MDNIPFIDLAAQQAHLGDRISLAMARVLAHGKYIMGPEVAALEASLTAFCGAQHALGCSSGTDALSLPLMAWGVGPGDAVFVPSFTFAATAEVVALLGATPVFVDVERNSFNMAVANLKAAIMRAKSLGLTPKVVIPVGLFGAPADMDALAAVARQENLLILDDAAQSFGGHYKGRQVGTLADATATSFFPAKPLGCYGDGGAVFTDDDELIATMRSLRVHGQGSDKYDNTRIGLNARLDTIQAAVLLEKLGIFEEELEKRQQVAARYNAGLGAVNAITVPVVAADCRSAWAQYTLVVDDRDRLQQRLKAANVPSAIYYPLPLHQQGAYKHYPVPETGNPNAEWLAARVISLPMHPYLQPDVQDYIIAAVLA